MDLTSTFPSIDMATFVCEHRGYHCTIRGFVSLPHSVASLSHAGDGGDTLMLRSMLIPAAMPDDRVHKR